MQTSLSPLLRVVQEVALCKIVLRRSQYKGLKCTCDVCDTYFEQKNSVFDSSKTQTFAFFSDYFHQIVSPTAEVLFEKQTA